MAAQQTKKTPFARFFSSVVGHLVSRYGSASSTQGPTLIGAIRKTAGPAETVAAEGAIGERPAWQTYDIDGAVTWKPDEVIAITDLEATMFAREYNRAVKNGALVERTEEDYLEFVAASRKLEAETAKRLELEAQE